MIKLIMSDMDGTLLDGNGRLPTGFDAMMAKLKERGVMFAPASGRQYYSLLDTFPAYADEFIFIAENGTLVKQHGKELFSSPITHEIACEVLAAGLKLPGILCVYCGKKNAYILSSQNRQEYQEELAKYYTHNAVVDDFNDVDDEPIKLAFYDQNGKASQSIYEHLKQFEGRLQVVRSSDWWVDVMSTGISKGIAIQQIQQKLGLTPRECAAFGDYLNDAEMMGSVYYSFAVANAHHAIKKMARFETKSNEEQGVLAGIQKLMDEGLI